MKIIVGITGATGTIFGVRLLEVMKDAGVETHLVMSKWGIRTLLHETPYTVDYEVARRAYVRRYGSGCRDFERLVRHRGDERRAMQHAYAGGDRARPGGQPHSPGGRRHSQRTA